MSPSRNLNEITNNCLKKISLYVEKLLRIAILFIRYLFCYPGFVFLSPPPCDFIMHSVKITYDCHLAFSKHVCSGVPQCSVLSPTLYFFVYINDFLNLISALSIPTVTIPPCIFQRLSLDIHPYRN